MKKILLATTMLAGTAGFAAAEVALSGYAEMGIVGGANVGDTQFHQDIDVTFTMSGETDGGLSFGASVDLDEAAGGLAATTSGADGYAVFVSGAFGKLTMGDTDGAFDWAMSELTNLTTMGDDHSSHVGFSGNSGLDGDNDGQVVRYEYAFGDFGVAASIELDDDGLATDENILGIGGTWKGAAGGVDLTVGAGYQKRGDDNAAGISVVGSSAGISAGLNYSSVEVAAVETTHTGVMLGYTTGALSVEVNYGEFDTAGVTTDGYGLAVNYDLGGGAVVMAGYGSDIVNAGTVADPTVAGDERYTIGLGLSF